MKVCGARPVDAACGFSAEAIVAAYPVDETKGLRDVLLPVGPVVSTLEFRILVQNVVLKECRVELPIG